jgi:hypothetical protein
VQQQDGQKKKQKTKNKTKHKLADYTSKHTSFGITDMFGCFSKQGCRLKQTPNTFPAVLQTSPSLHASDFQIALRRANERRNNFCLKKNQNTNTNSCESKGRRALPAGASVGRVKGAGADANLLTAIMTTLTTTTTI